MLGTLQLWLHQLSSSSTGRRRSRERTNLACESLEGRELLAAQAFAAGAEIHALARAVKLSPAFLAAEQQLGSDLGAIGTRANISSAQISAFENDVNLAGRAARGPASVRSLRILQRDLSSMSSSGTLNIALFQKDANAALSSAGVPRTLIAQIGADASPILSSPNITPSDNLTLANDVAAALATLGRRR